MKNNVTMQEIADSLQISKALVSRALSNKDGVSDETREKVRLAAIRLGYQINSSVMSVPSSRTGLIALLMPREDMGRELQYWGRIVRTIEEELEKKSLSLILSGIDPGIPASKGTPSCITDRKVDGAFILGRIPEAYILEVYSTGIPIVLVDSIKAPQIKAYHVLADNYEGGYDATRYLLEAGHGKIGFVGDVTYALSFNERYRGFVDAINDYGREFKEIESFHFTSVCEDEHFPLCIAQIDEALKCKNRPTALFCANDQNAFSIYELLGNHGLVCPDDISIIGFDNLEKCEWVTPALTTVDACKNSIGKRSVRLLLTRMEEPELRPEHVLISTEILKRSSVKRI